MDKLLYFLRDILLQLIFIGIATLVTGLVGASIGLIYALFLTLFFMLLFLFVTFIKWQRNEEPRRRAAGYLVQSPTLSLRRDVVDCILSLDFAHNSLSSARCHVYQPC